MGREQRERNLGLERRSRPPSTRVLQKSRNVGRVKRSASCNLLIIYGSAALDAPQDQALATPSLGWESVWSQSSRPPVCSPRRTLVLPSNEGGLTTRLRGGAGAHAGPALGSTGQDPPKLGELVLQAAGAVGLEQLVQAQGVMVLAHNPQARACRPGRSPGRARWSRRSSRITAARWLSCLSSHAARTAGEKGARRPVWAR